MAALVAELGWAEATAAKLLEPDFAGRTGFASYELTNDGAEIRRLEKRIADMERDDAAPARDDVEIGDVRVSQGDNRVQVFFKGKPAEALRAELKAAGFRWAPSSGAWQRMPSAWAWHEACRIAKLATGEKV